MHKYTFIGGFVFNSKPFECFESFGFVQQYIDINTLLTAPFSLEDLAHAIIATLALHQNNSLIAYSAGGLVAIKIAFLRPDLIKQLVLINSTPKFIEAELWHGIKAHEAKRLTAKLTRLSLRDFMQYFTQLAAHPHKVNVNEYSSWWSDTCQENLTALMDIVVDTDLRDELKQLSTEVLFINSALDILVPKNVLPHSQICLDESTHLQLNQRDLLACFESVLCH